MRERRIPRHVPVVPDDGVDYSELLAVVGVHEPVRNLGEVGPADRQGCVTAFVSSGDTCKYSLFAYQP